MKKLTFLFTLSFLTSFCFAQTIWTGGTGDWNVAANWSTGAVPTFADDVEINSGDVKIPSGYTAEAKSLIIGPSGSLLVAQNGTLNISGTEDLNGIKNLGSLTLRGTIDINGVTGAGFFIGNGFYNYDNFQIGPKGRLRIQNTDSNGLNNMEGSITNKGQIKILGGISGDGIYNTALLKNAKKGSILCQDGKIKNTTLGTLTNIGLITLSTPNASGLLNFGAVTNFSNAKINILNSSGGINTIGAPSSFDNQGTIIIDGGDLTGISIKEAAIFTNAKGATVSIDNVSRGIWTYSTFNPKMINSGTLLLLSGISGYGMENYGTFTNEPCAYFETWAEIYNNSVTGTFTNSGWMVNKYTGSYYQTGTMVNQGILEDNAGILSGLVTNDKTIVQTLDPAPQVGVPYPNTLDISSLTGYDDPTWYYDIPNGLLAGTYDPVANELTVNAATVGLTKLRVRFVDTSNGSCEHYFTADVPSGVAPLKGGGGTSAMLANGSGVLNFGEAETQEIQVFPNPSDGRFEVRLPANEEAAFDLKLMDATGRVLLRKNVEGGTAGLEMDLPEGIYFLHVSQNGQVVGQEKIMVTGR